MKKENALELYPKADGYKSVSLSVQKANYAMKMYQKAGFKVISDDAEEAIMKCSLI